MNTIIIFWATVFAIVLFFLSILFKTIATILRSGIDVITSVVIVLIAGAALCIVLYLLSMFITSIVADTFWSSLFDHIFWWILAIPILYFLYFLATIAFGFVSVAAYVIYDAIAVIIPIFEDFSDFFTAQNHKLLNIISQRSR